MQLTLYMVKLYALCRVPYVNSAHAACRVVDGGWWCTHVAPADLFRGGCVFDAAGRTQHEQEVEELPEWRAQLQ